jgi:hypothetical protein
MTLVSVIVDGVLESGAEILQRRGRPATSEAVTALRHEGRMLAIRLLPRLSSGVEEIAWVLQKECGAAALRALAEV